MIDIGEIKLTAMADALTVPDAGFTVDASGRDVTSGYAVSVHPDASQMFDHVTSLDLIDYVIRNYDLLILPGRVFGGWRNPSSGYVYLDVSVVTHDLEEAMALGRDHEQLAIYDFSERSSLPVA